MIDYDPLIDHQKILGSTFVNALSGSDSSILTDGRRHYSKHHLVREFGTGNFLAARRLALLMKEWKLKSIMDFFKMPPRSLGEQKGVGTTMLYVLICIGRAKGVDIQAWYKQETTFDTLKTQVRKDHQQEAADKKSRVRKAKAKKHGALKLAGDHVIETRESGKLRKTG